MSPRILIRAIVRVVPGAGQKIIQVPDTHASGGGWWMGHAAIAKVRVPHATTKALGVLSAVLHAVGKYEQNSRIHSRLQKLSMSQCDLHQDGGGAMSRFAILQLLF
jgi:hypothetical protein